MLNLTSGEATQWTVFEEEYIFTVNKEQGQCDELVFTVEAETDVGSSGISPNTTGGFPTCKKNTFFQSNYGMFFSYVQLLVPVLWMRQN